RTAISRRRVLSAMAACSAANLLPGVCAAQSPIPTRTIPRTGEMLPIVGLGSTRPVSGITDLGSDTVERIVRTLVNAGGKVVDTWPTDAANDGAFGKILALAGLREQLFVTINLTQSDPQEAEAHFSRTMQLYDRQTIDLVNVGNLTNIAENWPNLQAWQDAGRARYTGVTVASEQLLAPLEAFVQSRRPDFVMVNYSVSERLAEQRLLPLCADLGVAVLVSRPFMNGSYFDRLEGVALPDWSTEIECETWAQFSLQYILANPAVTCVLTETTNPAHMADNAATANMPYPGERIRMRMRDLIDSL
ncbi:MAG TPA: aldo/keto reductase, partial [Gammaproteobacteria bacterium]|nr:aldo/keto reductase [Gammaproteobacteria bacterium]